MNNGGISRDASFACALVCFPVCTRKTSPSFPSKLRRATTRNETKEIHKHTAGGATKEWGGRFWLFVCFVKPKRKSSPLNPPPLFFPWSVRTRGGSYRRGTPYLLFFVVVVVGKPNCPSTENYQKKTVATCSCDFGFSVWCTGNRRKTVFVSGGGER